MAEVTCMSKPLAIIPMVVIGVQDFIAAGQFRGGEQLIDAQQVKHPGTILTFLEPLYEGGLEGVTPGSSCIANAYTSNHEILASKESAFSVAFPPRFDAVGIVHAMLAPHSGVPASRQNARLVRTLIIGGRAGPTRERYLDSVTVARSTGSGELAGSVRIIGAIQ